MWLPTFASIVLLLWTPALSSQQPPPDPQIYPCLPFEPDNTIEWREDAAYGLPNFAQVVIADLNGDHDPDAVVLAGGVPVVLWNIALFDAPRFIQLPSENPLQNVKGLTVVPGAGANGADGIAMTDARGLFLVTWGGSAFDAPTLLSGSAWANAGPIHAIDLDYNGTVEFLGVSADRRKILAYYPTNSSNLAIPLTYDIFDVVGANWNKVGRRELCALTAQGLRIYTTAGALFASVSHVATSGCIARVRINTTTSSLDELIAWTRPASGGGGELVVLAHQHNEAVRALDFDFCEYTSQITPTALVTGNYDNDSQGNDDLVLVHAGQSAVVMVNQGVSAQHFDTDPDEYDIVPLSETPLAAGSVGIPAFAQVDPEEGVNPDDLVFPVSETEKIQVFLRLPYYRHAIGTAPPTSAAVFWDMTEYHPVTDYELWIAFHLDARYADYDYVEITIWHQSTESVGLDRVAVSYTQHQLADGDSPDQYVNVPYHFLPDDPEHCWPDDGPHFYTELRFTRDLPEARSRYFTAGFRLEDCGGEPPLSPPYDHYLVTHGIPNADFPLRINTNLPPGPPVYGNNVIGVYVPMSAQPPFDDGLDPPSRPTLVPGPAAIGYQN
jgi:hypothetical protein